MTKNVFKTSIFEDWFSNLQDRQAKRKIQVRIDRLKSGHFGDYKSIGEGVLEMRVHLGPGYRIYFTQRGLEIIVILAGGDKSSQDRDIRTALQLARNRNLIKVQGNDNRDTE